MPELPEVETMRRGILEIVGRRISEVEKVRNSCRPIRIEPTLPNFRKRVVGQRINAIDRLGKRVVLVLESGDAVVFEPRMTGLVLLADPPDCGHLRMRIRFEKTTQELLFWDQRGLGGVLLYSPSELERDLLNGKLGPDAMVISTEILKERLLKTSRPIKVALLDQQLVAGIGNLYASEILHRAKIHPERPSKDLRSDEWASLYSSMRFVLEEAIRYEGSTLSDGTYRNALNKSGGYQNHHQVYDREGDKCGTCRRGVIERIVQAQRSTFFCSNCQTTR